MHDFLWRFSNLPRDGEGGGGGGGDGGGQQQQQLPAWTPPSTLPTHLAGTTAEETVNKLLGAYLPAREQLSAIPKPPETADAYTLVLEGALAGYGDTLKNDPIMPEARQLAHGIGMSQEQFQKFVGGFINIMHDKGAFAPLPTDDKIAEGLIDANLSGIARGEAVSGATKRLTDARAWVDALKNGQSDFSDHERAELAMMVNSPGGIQLVERMMKLAGQQTVNPGGAGADEANAMAEYEKRLADPRNATDPAFAEQTRELSKRLFARR